MRNDPVVITGTGLVSALGHGATETWNALLEGRHAVRPIDHFEASGFPYRAAAPITGLDPSSLGLHQRSSRSPDLPFMLLMKCARQAMQQAKLDVAGPRGEEIGLFVAMGMVDCHPEDLIPAVMASRDSSGALDLDAFYCAGYQKIHPLWPLSMLNNMSVCRTAIELGIRGDNAVFAPEAVAGMQALVEGVKSLYQETTAAVLAGGMSEPVSLFSLARAHLQGLFEGPQHDRPALRDGHDAAPGEGGAIVALERRSSAERRGAGFTTAIAGYGAACEADRNAAGPAAAAIARSMADALRTAGLASSDIDVIMSQAPGSVARHHSGVLRDMFGSCPDVRIYSSESALGNLSAGAVPVDAIIGSRMIESGIVPGTAGCPELFSLVGSPAGPTRPIKRVLLTCASPLGQCAALILEAAG
jgi:3-oxoacyl-[acyl-carrier-protein] synthase II